MASASISPMMRREVAGRPRCFPRASAAFIPAVTRSRFLGWCGGTKVARRRPPGRSGMLVEGTMPRPYSADLRERVLSAHEHGEGNAAAPSRASGGEAVSGGGQYSEELGAGGRNRGAAGRQTAGPRSGAALGHGGMRGAAPIGGGRQRCDFGRILHLPLPRYSPDLSPIEPCWSKLKTLLRAAEPRSIAAIDEQIGPALDTITLQDARGWFRHCGYPLSN